MCYRFLSPKIFRSKTIYLWVTFKSGIDKTLNIFIFFFSSSIIAIPWWTTRKRTIIFVYHFLSVIFKSMVSLTQAKCEVHDWPNERVWKTRKGIGGMQHFDIGNLGRCLKSGISALRCPLWGCFADADVLFCPQPHLTHVGNRGLKQILSPPALLHSLASQQP